MLLFTSFTNTTLAEPRLTQLNNELIQSMQQGGYIIYFRHTKTDHDVYGTFPVDFNDCQKQRPLSETGRQQAVSIGQVLKQLNIPIGLVLSSPYCRTTDTAMLAFERTETDDLLASSYNLKKPDRDKAATHLRKLINTLPGNNTNTVIVGHSSNIRDAMNDWPKPEGAMLIYNVANESEATLVTLIKPQDWERYIHE